jgi:hypothetical protein
MCGLMVNIPKASSESGVSREYAMKAAFIYKFTKFIEWSPETFSDDRDPLILAVIGRDPFGKAIDVLHGRNVKGRKILVKRITSTEDIDKSHILFISRSEKKRLPALLQKTRDLCVLTIGDMEEFSVYGGIINFFMVENTIRFEINVAAARQAGLNISSNLLTLAKITGNQSKNGKN